MVAVSDRVAGDLIRHLPRVLALCEARETADKNSKRIVQLALKAICKSKRKSDGEHGG